MINSTVPDRAAANPSSHPPPKKTDSAAEIMAYISRFTQVGILGVSQMRLTSARRVSRSQGDAQIFLERALAFATFPKSVTRSLIRLVWVRQRPSSVITVVMMLDVMVKTSARLKP